VKWLLAQAMGVQLLFATAILDYDTLEEFSSFARLRVQASPASVCSPSCCRHGLASQGFIQLRWPKQDVAQTFTHTFRAQCLGAHGLVGVERIHDGVQ
jgi:hypothetical protein